MDRISTEGRPEALSLTAKQIFPGDSDMAQVMRAKDWSQTPLGPVQDWPQSLRTIVSVCLASRFPILIWWGPELTMLYNDAYRDIIAAKHPRAIGAPGHRVFPEVWDVIGPMLDGVLREGKATWSDDQLLLLDRNGFSEECYFTFSYSPIQDESGGVGGVFCAVTETTARVLGDRRTRLARDVAAALVDAHTAEEICMRAARVLAGDSRDVPFALLYLLDADGEQARLACCVGLEADSPLAPSSVELTAASGGAGWPLGRVARRNRREVIGGLLERWGNDAVQAGHELTPHTALILPVTEPGRSSPSALLVAGVSPMLALDDEYNGFFELLVSHLSAGLASAHAYEEERKRAEALAEIDRAKTEFFSNVSHEFRTPLTLMLGPIEDGLSDAAHPLPPEQRERQELAHRNGLRLLKLVNTLLDFARIEAGRVQAVYEPTDLPSYTAELASSFRSLIEKAGMTLTVDCPPLDGKLAEPVYVDHEMWEKIVLNLLSNAFKFTFAGSIAVTLHASDDGRRVILRVSDTGTGIAPEELPRLFERFHRVQSAQSRSFEGSGIGLALVQELVHLHGGSITAGSQVGVGSTFTVMLPTGTAHLPADRVQTRRTAVTAALGAATYIEEARRWLPEAHDSRDDHNGHAGDGAATDDARWLGEDIGPTAFPATMAIAADTATPARVLLADDNADLRDYLRRLLAEHYDVEVVANGAEALDAARARPPDLVLTDVMMPELDGFGLLHALRSDPATRAIPVILLSARAGAEATVEGLEAGADDYLIKPFSAGEVLARVASHLEMARLRQAALARAQELEATFAAMADGVAVYDTEGHILAGNAAYRDMVGRVIGVEHLTGTLAERGARTQFLDGDGRPLAQAEWPQSRILAGETIAGPSAAEVAFDTPTGRVYYSMAGSPLRAPDGTITGIVLIIRDVTERRTLERRTREALDALLELAAAMVSDSAEGSGLPRELTGDFAHRQADDALCRFAAMCSRVLDSERIAIIAVDDETDLLRTVAVIGSSSEQEQQFRVAFSGLRLADRFGDEIAEQLQHGETALVDVDRLQEGDPARILSRRLFLLAPMRAAGALYGYIGVNYGDEVEHYTAENRALALAVAQLIGMVMERARLTHERAAAEARELALTEANRRMDEFLGIASHELRTPLTSVTANVQMAERQLGALVARGRAEPGEADAQPDPKIARAALLLERTGRQVQRLDRLVGDLLDASRIQAGKLELRMETCDLLEIVRDAVQEQRVAWPSRGIELDLPRRADLPVSVDADRIGQVLTNYVTNALKYSPAEQPVAVRVRVPRNHTVVRVEVRDAGPGLSLEQQAHLFERFHRVPDIEQQSGSGVGLGLGLYICKTIVERHGGAVGVESAPGAGSTFWFELPMKQQAG